MSHSLRLCTIVDRIKKRPSTKSKFGTALLLRLSVGNKLYFFRASNTNTK